MTQIARLSDKLPQQIAEITAAAWSIFLMRAVLVCGLVQFIATSGHAKCDEPKAASPAPDNWEEVEPRWASRCRVLRNCAETKWQFIQSRGGQTQEALSDAEQIEAKRRMLQDVANVSARINKLLFEELESHVENSHAVETLTWIANTREAKSVQAAIDLLAEHHLTRQETIELAIRNERSPMRWVDPLLTKLLHRLDADHFRRPRILLALATHKQSDSQLTAHLASATDTELHELELMYGRATIADCRRINAPEKERHAIELFRQLEQQYGSQPATKAMTFGELATAAIFEMTNLAIGKVAPDLEGEDLDGKPLKLSDYRGKVVMISFWGTWCGPCMARIPQEREFVKKLRDKPFVLLGVNSDPDKKQLHDEIVRHEISWRSFWCGPKGVDGAIPRRWNINAWPTVYVLDHRGVIRAKDPTGPALDQLLDKLIAETGRE